MSRLARVHISVVIVLALVAGGLFLARAALIVSAADVLGVEEHHDATITSIEERPWYRGVGCRTPNSRDEHEISLRWADPEPGEGAYTVCLRSGHPGYQVGMSQQVITDPWFGYVRKDESLFASLWILGVFAFLAVLLVPIGIWQYVVAVRAARDPDPRVIG